MHSGNIMESSLVHQVVIDKEDWRQRPSLHQVSLTLIWCQIPDSWYQVSCTNHFLIREVLMLAKLKCQFSSASACLTLFTKLHCTALHGASMFIFWLFEVEFTVGNLLRWSSMRSPTLRLAWCAALDAKSGSWQIRRCSAPFSGSLTVWIKIVQNF